ncbi:hypothetical protein PDENDC454_10940 [Paenibacillus dendritiformis C454]|uniref:Uncharacterized protein n=1 Tax=Paenibacillus dendritiformis C454 TaxID=1131935 RepID=H3SF83_9BACL|nr:hypothetical protein PDENDC454_10940 [Paenibacillus dendritiformis C454]PZM66642.1 hypothetical protein DOE73_05540 [Paenibacillus dendritiformis]
MNKTKQPSLGTSSRRLMLFSSAARVLKPGGEGEMFTSLGWRSLLFEGLRQRFFLRFTAFLQELFLSVTKKITVGRDIS